jgi:glycosyltransferase involved in cell wall biosynthesis
MNTEWQVPGFGLEQFRSRTHRYAICIFVINEGEKIRMQLSRMSDYASVIDIVVCDGGSTDGSLDFHFLKETRVTAILTKKGPGRLSTQMRMGLAWCMDQGYEGCLIIDGNGKDGLEAIPEFIRLLDLGLDHIQGSRFIPGGKHKNTPFLRLIGVRWVHAPLVSLASRFRYTDTTNGFRGYSRKFLLDKKVLPFRNCFTDYELHYYLAIRAARLGFQVCETPVSRNYPDGGTVPTKISGVKGKVSLLATLLKAVMHQYNP